MQKEKFFELLGWIGMVTAILMYVFYFQQIQQNLSGGPKGNCPVLRKVDSYFCYYLVICFFMLYATFDECTCSGVSKFKAQCGRLLL